MRAALRRAVLAAMLLGAPLATPARAIDCSFGDCIDMARLPAGAVDVGAIIRKAQRLFGVDAEVYIVASREVGAPLPYMLPRKPPFVMADQIHIPEIYHILTERKHHGEPHYVWHYIIGHEMAHAYQNKIHLIEALSRPTNSVVMAELHADYLAGFFMAREFGLEPIAVEQILREINSLPSGAPGSPNYHGSPGERFFAASQGALFALSRPAPSLAAASARGVDCVFALVAPTGEDSVCR